MKVISPITMAYTVRYFRARVDTVSEWPTWAFSRLSNRSFGFDFRENLLSNP